VTQQFAKQLVSPPKRLIGAAFFKDATSSAVSLGVQFSAISLGATPLTLGLLGTLPSGLYTFACLVSGHLSDRIGHRRTVLMSVITLAVLWSLMAPANEVWHLLALVTVGGLAHAMFWAPLEAWLAALASANVKLLNKVLSWFNVAWCLGVMLGPLLVGYLWTVAGTNSFYFAAALTLVIIALVATTPSGPEPRTAVQSEKRQGAHAPDSETRRFIIVGRLGNFAACFAIGIVRTMFPKLGDTLGFSAVVIGNMIACFYVTRLVLFWVAGRSSRWQYRGWILWFGAPVGIVGMLLAARAQTPMAFVVAFMIAGVCITVTYLTSIFYGMQSHPEVRGASMAIHEAVVGGGMVVGPLLGGLVATWFNLRAPFLLAAVVLLLAGVGQLVAWRRLRDQQPHGQLLTDDGD